MGILKKRSKKSNVNKEQKAKKPEKKIIYVGDEKPKDRFALIKKIDAMTTFHAKNINFNTKIPEELAFNCNDCGNCCRNTRYKIPVLTTDIGKWLNTNNSIYIRVLDHNRGHPVFLFFLITKQEFSNKMEENHGKSAYLHMLKVNPSLEPDNIKEEDLNDCVFYNPYEKECAIYQHRPLHCVLYPFINLLALDLEDLFSKGYRKVAGMKLKDKDFKVFLNNTNFYDVQCPEEVLTNAVENLKSVKISKMEKRITRYIIGALFSGNLYFKNRRDIFEQVMWAIFGKD